ncbi:hypothetical protein V1509DRAFT_633967 [Lipomyces kononenkoae]
MGIQRKLASFYNKQASSPSTAQLVPSRHRSAVTKESSSSASSYSSDSGDLRNVRVGRNSLTKVHGHQPPRQGNHDGKYPRIGYFHPQSNFIRARFPTPRGPQPKIEAFISTAGQAAQLSASVPPSPVRPLVTLSKSVKENHPDGQDGLHGTIRSVLSFGSRKRRRYGHAGQEAKGRRLPLLPPMRFLSGGSLHILDNINSAVKTKEEEPKILPVPLVAQSSRDKQSDEIDTTRDDDDFDTEEAIARLNIIAAAPVQTNPVQKPDDLPTLWRRLSQRARTPSSDQSHPNNDPPVKFNLPSPTMLNTYDRTSGFVNIPMASSDGNTPNRDTNSMLLSTVSNNDISDDDDFFVEPPKSRNSKLERGLPYRKLSHMSGIIHCASMTIRRKARQHRVGNISVNHVMRDGNDDTGAATTRIGDITGTTSLANSEPVMSCEVSKLSGRSGSLKARNRTVDGEDGSFLRRLKSRVLAFVTPLTQRQLIRKAKPAVPVTGQVEQLYGSMDNKKVNKVCMDKHVPKHQTIDDELKKEDPNSATANQGRVIDAPVIDTSNLSPSDWDQITPGTQTTFVASPTADMPNKPGTVLSEDDGFVIVETPIMHTPVRDDLSVKVLSPVAQQQQQACSPMSSATDPFRSPIVTVSDSGSTLVSPRSP